MLQCGPVISHDIRHLHSRKCAWKCHLWTFSHVVPSSMCVPALWCVLLQCMSCAMQADDLLPWWRVHAASVHCQVPGVHCAVLARLSYVWCTPPPGRTPLLLGGCLLRAGASLDAVSHSRGYGHYTDGGATCLLGRTCVDTSHCLIGTLPHHSLGSTREHYCRTHLGNHTCGVSEWAFTLLTFIQYYSHFCHRFTYPGARPTKHISIKFEIWWKFRTL